MMISREREAMIRERDILREDFEERAKKLRSDIDSFLKLFNEKASILKMLVFSSC